MKYILYLLLIGLIFNSCSEATDEAVLLRLNPEVGKVYNMKLETDMQIKSAGFNVETNIIFDAEMKIEDVGDDTITIHVDYKRMRVNQQMPFVGSIKFDSDDTSTFTGRFADKYQEISKEVLNSNSTLKLSKYGRVISSTELSNLGGDPLSGGAPSGDELLGNIMAVYPEEELKVGDAWQKDIKISGQVPFEIAYTYTIKEIYKDAVTIDIDGIIKSSSDSADASFTTEDMKGTVSGEMLVNRHSGWTRSSEITQKVEMTIGQGAQKIPMKMETIIRINNE